MSFTEGKYPSDWLKAESPDLFSREKITILAGSGAARSLTNGMVLAKVTKGTASAAAAAGNTGNGTFGAITVGAAAKPGVYKVVCIEPAADAGKFTVEDPDGITVAAMTVAAAFSAGGLGFTLADGAADFVAGDSFNVTVAAGSGKWVQLNLSSTVGEDVAAGILFNDASAADGTDGVGVAIVRNAQIRADQLTWPGGATTNQKNAALAQLKALGIIERVGA